MLRACSNHFHGNCAQCWNQCLPVFSFLSSFCSLSLSFHFPISSLFPLPSSPPHPLLCSRHHAQLFHIHSLILPSQTPCEEDINYAHFTDEDVVAQKSSIMSWTRLVPKALSLNPLNSTCFLLSTCPRPMSPSWVPSLASLSSHLTPPPFLPSILGFHFSFLSPRVTDQPHSVSCSLVPFSS